MINGQNLSKLYPEKAQNVLQNLYAANELDNFSINDSLTRSDISELNPNTPEETMDIVLEDLIAGGSIDLVSIKQEETYRITDQGYQIVEEYLPTEEILDDHRRLEF